MEIFLFFFVLLTSVATVHALRWALRLERGMGFFVRLAGCLSREGRVGGRECACTPVRICRTDQRETEGNFHSGPIARCNCYGHASEVKPPIVRREGWYTNMELNHMVWHI